MASSSTSSLEKSYKYDVFLSFRGDDTRKNLVDHLYSALQQHGIHTHKDDERLQKGKRINDELLKSIQDSKLCIIVFSKNYASSSWCLDELVKIMECQKMTTDQIAYPVFFDVDPSEVRKQRGPVGEAFAKHNKLEEAGKWRDALEEAANLAGWDLRNTADGHEAKVIKIIVEQISLELRSIHLSNDENLIGMEPRMQGLESSLEIGLNDVRMIGIKGIGGGGKTTLARTIFDRVSIQFEGKSFVENVREVSKASGLQLLQIQVLSDVLNEKDVTLRSVRDGYSMMKMRLHGKKVLVVLDDVDHIDQLEALAGKPNWFKPGSRIIITTRDEQVLVAHGVKWIHDVNLLTDVEAICLFSRHAFGREIPVQGYEKLSLEVVRYAAGLPLTIRVLGSFLCSKNEFEWIDALERLKTIPLKETLEKLELSYIGLEDDYKEIFLDVACLLKGWLKEDAIRILESCGFHARNGLRVLEQKSLITINAYQHLGMHDHIEEMGKNIVRRLHPDEPNKHSRLWIREEIEDILVNDLGSEATRAMAVDSLELGPEIVTKGFGNMKKLRFLHVGPKITDTFIYDNSFYLKVKIDQVCEKFPDGLRFLSWDYYPRQSLPNTFRANNLVALEMRGSKIVRLWGEGERKILNKLRFLNLSSSELRSLDLGGTPNLERLDLQQCFELVELQAPVGCLKRLLYLNLNHCRNFKSFSFIKQLESLEVLCLNHLNLKEFPDIIPGHWNNSLLELQFRENNLAELPSSIANLHKLIYLDLRGCRKLRSLRGSICGLQHLRNLNIYGCLHLEELPKKIDHLECLEKLTLTFSRIKNLPDNICMLKYLKTLNLSSCLNLEKLPWDIGRLECLENLRLMMCILLRDIPDSICKLKRLKYFNLAHCVGLKKLPEDLGLLERLEVLDVQGTCIRQLPRSISLLKGLKIYGSKSVLQTLDFGSTSGILKASS